MNTTLKEQILSPWPEWHQQPFRLTCNEINQPQQVFKDFFSWYTLQDFRLCLKEWLTDALRAEDVEALEYVSLHDNVEKLVEAAWVVLERDNKKPVDIPDNIVIKTPIIIHHQESEELIADPLECIIDIIVKTAQPEKIFLLDAQGNDNAGHAAQYDLLVLLPGKLQHSFKELQNAIETACKDIADVLVRFSKAVETYRLIKEGHIFFSMVCTNDNLIYDDGKEPLPVSAISDVTAIKAKALETFNKIFRIARLFLEGAGYFHCRQAKDIAAFMLQQATEHCFRALLYAFTGHNHVTHNLQKLLRYVRQCAPELYEAFPSDVEESKRLLNLLYKAYVHARYKEGYRIEENDLQTLFNLVYQLHQKTEQVFQAKIDQKAKQGQIEFARTGEHSV